MEDLQRFQRISGSIGEAVQVRVQVYVNALLHTRSFFDAAPGVTRDEFKTFVDSLNLAETYPGLQGIGFTKRVMPDELESHVEAVRKQGHPDYRVWPEHERDEYFSIVYLEPFDWRNQRAFGFDMMTEPTRRQAMERARDTGRAVASGRVTLVQETEVEPQPGFLIYVPLYHPGTPTSTVEERRAALLGFVYSPFRTGDLFEQISSEIAGPSPRIAIRIYDGTSPANASALYSSPGFDENLPEAERMDLVQIAQIPVAGREWTIQAVALPSFRLASTTSLPWYVLMGCFVISLLIYLVVRFARRHNEMLSADLARRKAAEVRLREEKRIVELTSKIGLSLRAEHDVHKIVQIATDSATELTNASFGAFFYDGEGEDGKSRAFYALSDASREALSKFPMPREGTVRLDDVTTDPRFGRNQPHVGMAEGNLPLRSYLAAPVISRTGKILGGLFFGHSEGGVFTDRAEKIVESIAAQAAVALDNACLFKSLRIAEERTREAKEMAEAANRAKSRFLANMSHEIRTPLGVIIGFADLALYGGGGKGQSTDIQSYLKAIKRNGEQLTEIIGDVLDLSKIEADRMEIEKSGFSIRSLLKETVSNLDVRAREKSVLLVYEEDQGLPEFVHSDPTRVRQILVNMIGNAIKFTDRGQVKVTARLAESRTDGDAPKIEVAVEDSGIGIRPEDKANLFKPFMQGDTSASRRHGGTGLGLLISRRLARALGGDLVLRSSEPGKGSVFVLTIDMGEPAGAGTESVRAHEPGTNTAVEFALRGTRILLVEDAPDNQVLISRYLNGAGAHVDVANNGLEGVAKAQAQDYDVVLMDIQMPVLDGYGAIKRLRASGYGKPIVALTAHALKEERLKALESGFSDYLTKPLNRKTLIERVRARIPEVAAQEV